jgi:hypothetical protein
MTITEPLMVIFDFIFRTFLRGSSIAMTTHTVVLLRVHGETH